MVRRAALGATLARKPLVVKLVADEAFERERRAGRFDGSLEEFQQAGGGARRRLLRTSRTAALRRARRVLVPSAAEARDVLAEGLRRHGATVENIPVYRTVPVEQDVAGLSSEIAARRIDAVTFTSSSTVRSFVRLVGPETATSGSFVAATIGPITAGTARELGLRDVIEAPWSVTNQARMHLANDDPAYASTEDALPHFLETPTAVAVRLSADDRIDVIAPWGPEDLFTLTVRPTPSGRAKPDVYRRRLAEKNWSASWGAVRVAD